MMAAGSLDGGRARGAAGGTSTAWLVIVSARGSRRVPLAVGTTTLGGGAADVPLEGVGGDRLEISGAPPRATFVGSGPPPFLWGAPLHEGALSPGDRIEWAGVRIEFQVDAPLEELPPPAAAPPRPARAAHERAPDPAQELERRAWRRVRAGLRLDLGLAPKGVVRRWQSRVLAGSFDPDACADEIEDGVAGAGAEARLLDRAGILLRDFLMASRLRGAAGAMRRLRTGTKRGVAMIVSQLVALLVYSLVLLLTMFFLRLRGTSWDAMLDSVAGLFDGK